MEYFKNKATGTVGYFDDEKFIEINPDTETIQEIEPNLNDLYAIPVEMYKSIARPTIQRHNALKISKKLLHDYPSQAKFIGMGKRRENLNFLC